MTVTSKPQAKVVKKEVMRTVIGLTSIGQIMRELEKAAREGRLKPIVIGPVEIEYPRKEVLPLLVSRRLREETSLGRSCVTSSAARAAKCRRRGKDKHRP